MDNKEKATAAPKVVASQKKKPVGKRRPRPEVSREVQEPPQKSDDHEEEQDEQSSEPEESAREHRETENLATKEKFEKWSELKRIF